jgi:SAM-dependent methyltransferase
VTDSLGVNANSDVYYTGTYWNDFEAVRRRINERVSGDPAVPWYEHFAKRTGRKFERALILNCGDGWVERDLLAHGLVAEAVGTDYSDELLNRARRAAKEDGLPLTYYQGNINTDILPPGPFDLVVNHAAAHHITAIDHVFRQLCRMLPDDGYFVHFDYVGPHRNQYRLDAWEEIWRINQELPHSFQQQLEYPPIPVMLVVDPTEAVHSELILETFRRYFLETDFAAFGGAIAYPLLTHNARIFEADDGPERAIWIDRIMDEDERFLKRDPRSTLFAFFAGTPKKAVLDRTELLEEWTAEEAERELHAQENGGEYYERGPLAAALAALEEERLLHTGAATRIEELQSQLDAIRASFLYTRVVRLLNSKMVRAVRAAPFAAAMERSLRRRRVR